MEDTEPYRIRARDDNEFKFAIILANKVLDDVWLDPDSNLSVLSRQFLRSIEER